MFSGLTDLKSSSVEMECSSRNYNGTLWIPYSPYLPGIATVTPAVYDPSHIQHLSQFLSDCLMD